MNTCIQCGSPHEKKGIYCSKSCTDKAYRLRKAGKAQGVKEIGNKLKWCNYCGESLEKSLMLQFCNPEHKKEYEKTVKSGKHLKIRLDAKTVIETKKYHRVQELIEAMIAREGYINFFR